MSTSWIDDDINYQQDDKGIIVQKGKKVIINKFIGNILKRGEGFRENKKKKDGFNMIS